MKRIKKMSDIAKCHKNGHSIAILENGNIGDYEPIGIFKKSKNWCLVEKDSRKLIEVSEFYP